MHKSESYPPNCGRQQYKRERRLRTLINGKMDKGSPATSETSGAKTTEGSSGSSSSAPRMKPKQPPSPQEKSLVKILEPSTDDEDEDDDELDLEDSGKFNQRRHSIRAYRYTLQ